MPWSVTYATAARDATTLDAVVGLLPADPEKVVVDVMPPTITWLEVTSSSPHDPVASNPYNLTVCFNASEAVRTPEVTILGGDALERSMLSGGGASWCAGPRVIVPEDGAETDKNGCVVFSVTLTDHAGNVGEAVTRQINAEGTANCPETRVELDLAARVPVAPDADDHARGHGVPRRAQRAAEVFFVAVPRGSTNRRPRRWRRGRAPPAPPPRARGPSRTRGATSRRPPPRERGIGLVELTVPDLDQGFRYDLYHRRRPVRAARDGSALEAARESGVWTPADGVRVKEGDGADVIVLELTQPPTADVTVELGTTLPGHEGQLLFALEANTLVYADARVTSRAAWSEPIEVKVKAVDDDVVEGHTSCRSR